MIQDIHPHQLDSQYVANLKPGVDDYVFHFSGNSFLLKVQEAAYALPRIKDFPELAEGCQGTYLFSLDGTPCFLVWDELGTKEPGFIYKEINFFRLITQAELAWASLVAYHLRNWYDHNRFCGKCGSATRHKDDERALICPSCETTVYPKISPAIIVAIVSGDSILLARNARFPGSWYSLVAGYADVAETLEEVVKREVKEEVGLDVTNIRYYKSQPWPLSGSMMVGFVAEADINQPVIIDGDEITEAAWFKRGALPNHSSTISIAGEMIKRFEQGTL
jgi:NAD+ diphosphatase